MLALALVELTEQALAARDAGRRRRVRPHVTLDVDLDTYLARRGGDLAIPGDDPVRLPSESIARILCDADLTPVITTPTRTDANRDACGEAIDRGHGGGGRDPDDVADPAGGHDRCIDPRPEPSWAGNRVPGWRATLITALREQTRTQLWLGRSRRTATRQLWTFVVHRDRHCIFPNCTIDPSRCEVHHPIPWEHGGTTDPENAALVCVRHHHAVHEGGWTMTPVDGADPLAPGYWQFSPPAGCPAGW